MRFGGQAMRIKLTLVIGLFASVLISCNSRTESPTPLPTHAAESAPTETAPTEIPAQEVEIDPALIAQGIDNAKALIKPDYPMVDGSTSAHPLQVLLACTIFDVPCSWQEGWGLDTTRRIGPDLSYEKSPQLVERIYNIWHNGTHGAYVNLIEGTSDFILVARPPSEDEQRQLKNGAFCWMYRPSRRTLLYFWRTPRTRWMIYRWRPYATFIRERSHAGQS
jgi:hypothetical protein